jgi:cAMP phosphodiesterase
MIYLIYNKHYDHGVILFVKTDRVRIQLKKSIFRSATIISVAQKHVHDVFPVAQIIASGWIFANRKSSKSLGSDLPWGGGE